MEQQADDPAAGLSVLHVIDQVSATNSQFNEHCLPVRHSRRVTVCSLLPARVAVPPEIVLVEGDGTRRGCYRALRRALQQAEYDVVHVHAAASGALALLVYLVLGRPRTDLVFTVHTSWPNVRPRNRVLLHLVVALFPVVVVCGHAAAASLPRRIRVLAGRLDVVPNGVDLDRVDRALAAGAESTGASDPSGHEVVSVGRLLALKEPGTVMAAFVGAAAPGDRLTIVGDGPLGPALAEAVHNGGLADRVRLTGLVPRDEVYPLLARADVFVSASRVEGLPVAVLEAMACRCPIVLSDIPPHREIARRAPHIPLVEVGDIDGLTTALAVLLRLPESERQRRGEALRRCVADHFSVAAMNARYGRLYARLSVRSRPAARPPELVRSPR